MQAKSCLSLKNYVVKTMMFSLNESFNFNSTATISLSPEFTRNITKIDNDNVAVNLIFRIDNKKGDMPFSMEVNIEELGTARFIPTNPLKFSSNLISLFANACFYDYC